jgi:hypothetical protein
MTRSLARDSPRAIPVRIRLADVTGNQARRTVRKADGGGAHYDDFVYRLLKFIADVARRLEDRIRQTAVADLQIRTARRRLSAATRSAPATDE